LQLAVCFKERLGLVKLVVSFAFARLRVVVFYRVGCLLGSFFEQFITGILGLTARPFRTAGHFNIIAYYRAKPHNAIMLSSEAARAVFPDAFPPHARLRKSSVTAKIASESKAVKGLSRHKPT
jgi:hypothetical protein